MKSKLSDNIRLLRKERHITQEQLAEAMNVTVGAVYKWEQDISTPDINVIMNLASFFSISLDALVGYEFHSSTVDSYVKRIIDLQNKKKYDAAVSEAEKALVLYPNNFQIVYYSGIMYHVKCVENIDKNRVNDANRSIELLELAKLLISQNTDPEISIYVIDLAISSCYLVKDEKDKALEILKKNNIRGINNARIGKIYSMSEEYSVEEAEPYLTAAFGDLANSLLSIMLGYANYYERKKDYKSELEAIEWLCKYLESIRNDSGRSYMDKYLGALYSECARLLYILDKKKESEDKLREAYKIADKFDREKNINNSDIRFFLSHPEIVPICDDAGPTAMYVIEEQIVREHWNENLRLLWDKIKEECK